MLNHLRFVKACLLAAIVCISCTPSQKSANGTGDGDTPNQLTRQQQKEGWELLFDGKTTSGWHNHGMKPAGSAWKIESGVLYLDIDSKKSGGAGAGGNLVTDREFENFHLKLEWKIAPGGNSGIMFYVHEDPARFSEPYMTGPEMQVLDNDGHSDGKIAKHRAGDLYDLIACSTETVKPVGEWNLAEIKCFNGKLDMYLNGSLVVSTTLWDDAWKNMVAGSKFKNWPGFGEFKKGRISLQDHGDKVSYRNIMIKTR